MSTSAPTSSVKPAVQRRRQLAHALDLFAQAARIEAHAEPDGRRVVGHVQVLVALRPRALDQLLERRLAVAPVGVGVQVAADLVDLDQVRQCMPLRAASISPRFSRSSGGIQSMPRRS